MPERAPRVYRFGPFVLDVADRSLKRQGAPVPLAPKTFDLLVTLVENAGRLVEKDALLRTVWPDVAVEEGNLTKGVFSLRQLLEEEAGPRYIETVPKRGYRFVASVTSSTDDPTPAIPAKPPVESPSENSIAVMPFSDMSAARDQEFFCEGNKRPGDVVWQALDRFERAIAVDPGFAPAYAALASVYGTLGAWEFGVLPPADALAKVKAAAKRALELDPQLAAGHTAVAYATLHFDWDAESACRQFDQAIALNPAWVDAHHWHSHALCAAGRFPESLAACRQIVELDPLNPLMHAHVAWHHYMARNYAEALTQAEQVVRMEPGFHWGYFFAGWALERLGRGSEAVSTLQDAVRCSADNPVMLAGLGHALAAHQDRKGALKIARELERFRGDRGLFAYEIAVIHATLGDDEKAFRWLTRAVKERSGWIAYLRVDPRLDLLPDRDGRSAGSPIAEIVRACGGSAVRPSDRPGHQAIRGNPRSNAGLQRVDSRTDPSSPAGHRAPGQRR